MPKKKNLALEAKAAPVLQEDQEFFSAFVSPALLEMSERMKTAEPVPVFEYEGDLDDLTPEQEAHIYAQTMKLRGYKDDDRE
jgi:hypothetical protein